MRVIYIASPYTLGDHAENVAVQMNAAHKILDMGHCPITPLLSHFLHIHRQRPYEEWLKMDLSLVEKCDILLRLPGESKGADIEVEHAYKCAKPVVRNFDELAEILNHQTFSTIP